MDVGIFTMLFPFQRTEFMDIQKMNVWIREAAH